MARTRVALVTGRGKRLDEAASRVNGQAISLDGGMVMK
jgi:hypothetical protein